jgi:DNA-binding CsgD family transcriptional regulator
MTTQPSGALRAACLLTALEPGAPRERIEDALVLLGQRAAAVDDALGKGLVRAASGRLDLVDGRVGRAVVAGAAERERRRAHLALACVRGGDRATTRRSFDALCLALEPAPARAPGRASPGEARLTPQERCVAELAATGARNCEIAAAAFVSKKTVEYHLTRIYRKLGVRSKSELIVALGTAGVVTVGH